MTNETEDSSQRSFQAINVFERKKSSWYAAFVSSYFFPRRDGCGTQFLFWFFFPPFLNSSRHSRTGVSIHSNQECSCITDLLGNLFSSFFFPRHRYLALLIFPPGQETVCQWPPLRFKEQVSRFFGAKTRPRHHSGRPCAAGYGPPR